MADETTHASELAALGANFTTLAVTGTNGKTSTTSMLAAIVEATGEPAVLVTTLGMWVAGEQTAEDGSMRSFLHTLRRARERGARTIALEVTSRALDAGFAERWPADVGVFTNLTPDHLDRHQTPERYLAAKARLFLGLRPPGVAVLNAADPASALLAEVIPQTTEVRGFGPPPATPPAQPERLPSALWAAQVVVGEQRTAITFAPSALAARLGGGLALQVAGGFQADNAIAAAVAADAAGIQPAAIQAGLAAFPGVPGRFEIVAHEPLVVVDFAHTPDALRRALHSARALAGARGGRLGCVFGCGGERDRAKRKIMGELADRLSDAVWLTTDNPRSEDPEAIAAMVRAGAQGCSPWRVVPDRARAIADAVGWARDCDVIVVAGRGCERVQHLGSGPVELCDRQAVLAACRLRRGDPPAG